MKRIILSVFAAAVTAAWAVPAHAVDITFSGQYRLRTEWRNDVNFDRTNNPDAQDSWGQRVRLTTNVKATDDTSVKITLQGTTIWGTEGLAPGGGPALTSRGGTTTLAFHEAYLNVNDALGAPVTLRAGRQELVYGDQRLIGNFDWSNEARAFDAVKLMYASDIVNVDAFWAKINDNNVLAADGIANTAGNDADFYGLYATVKTIPNNTIDLYVLNLTGNFSGDAAGTGFGNVTSNLTTIGARLNGSVMGLDYTLEVPYETGTHTTATDGKTSAYAADAKVGYSIPGAPAKLRVGAEYAYAEGTKAGAANNHTFFNLFPTNHNKFGIMDLAAWRNISAINVNASAEPTDKLRLYFAWWNLNKASDSDNWYQAANWNNTPTGAANAVQTDKTSTNKGIGNEIDLVATYKYSNALTAEVGYGHFFVGKYIEDAVAAAGGNKTDQDFAYLMLTANF